MRVIINRWEEVAGPFDDEAYARAWIRARNPRLDRYEPDFDPREEQWYVYRLTHVTVGVDR